MKEPKKKAEKKAPAAKKKAPAAKKIKVDELAKELGVDSKKLIGIFKDLNIDVKTKASSIDLESAKIVSDLIKAESTPAKTPTAPVEVKQKEAQKIEPPQKPEEPKKEAPPEKKPEEIQKPKNIISVSADEITVKDLAAKMNVRVGDLIKELMLKGILANINQRIALDIIKEITAKMGFEIIKEEIAVQEKTADEAKIDPSTLKVRPPVVTIMGHVDHGKTKLLDAIRKTNVTDTEAGGITQHIGAYQVEIKGKQITFLDTPGHEAFTALRARGATVTDIVVLVVAADDGVMPQTKEAIDHARASNVPIIVAINKMDKPGVNPDRVKQQLSDLGLMPEEWGGQTVTVGVSAIKGTGIETLLEMILLVAEMLELKAVFNTPAQGVVVESYMDRFMGPVGTVLVKEGVLRVGDAFYCGSVSGKTKALMNDRGKRMSKAGPSTPVKVLGFSSVPQSGEILQVVKSEIEARNIAEKKAMASEMVRARGKILSLEDFSQKIKSGEVKTLNLIIKADVHGSQEALVQSLEELSAGNIKTNIIRNSTGNITQSDIMLAKASEAIIVGFSVDFEGDAKILAEDEGIDARIYKIIYEVIDDIKLALEGMLEPEYEEFVNGGAQVRQLFKFSKVGTIAGSIVNSGKMVRGSMIRVLREGEKVFEGKLSTLKRFKDDVKEVAAGMECGITLDGFDALKVDDIIEQYEMKVKRKSVKS